MRVSLLVTCLGDALFPEVGVATVRLLRRLGQRANGGVAVFAFAAIPVASALAVVLAGVVVTLRALSQQGIL